MTNETPICFSITSIAWVSGLPKWLGERRIFPLFPRNAWYSGYNKQYKNEIQIHFSMSCEKEKCKWHLNSIFPCHRKTVGTKVHAFVSFTYLKPHQEAKETKYEISLNIMSRSRDPLSGKETLLTRFQIQIKVKKWSSSCKYLLQKKIKAEVIVPFQNILSSMPDFRDVVSVLPCN